MLNPESLEAIRPKSKVYISDANIQTGCNPHIRVGRPFPAPPSEIRGDLAARREKLHVLHVGGAKVGGVMQVCAAFFKNLVEGCSNEDVISGLASFCTATIWWIAFKVKMNPFWCPDESVLVMNFLVMKESLSCWCFIIKMLLAEDRDPREEGCVDSVIL